MSKEPDQIKKGRWSACPAPCGGRIDRHGSVNASKMALLITFLRICVKGNIHYCEPFPDTTIDLLEKYHKITIGRRWFFQCMRDIENAGYMRRRRRWKKSTHGEIMSISSLWWFTIRGARYLKSKSIQGSQDLLKSLLTWARRGDDRAPTFRDLVGTDPPTDQEGAVKRIRALIQDIG